MYVDNTMRAFHLLDLINSSQILPLSHDTQL